MKKVTLQGAIHKNHRAMKELKPPTVTEAILAAVIPELEALLEEKLSEAQARREQGALDPEGLEFLTISEAARRFKIGETTLRRWIFEERRIQAYRPQGAKTWRVKYMELKGLIMEEKS